MPTTRIAEILNLQQAITGDTFLRLGIHVLEAEKLEEQQRKTQKETKLIALDVLQLSKSGKRAISRVGRKLTHRLCPGCRTGAGRAFLR